MDDKLKDRLQKLKNLAERGVGGEKETAERKFQQLLADNGLTESDLVEDRTNYYLFSYTFPHRKRLLAQIIYTVVGAENAVLYHSKHTRNKYGVYCTAAQKLEIDLQFEFYCNLFETELEAFMTAFIAKQDLYPEDAPIEPIDVSTLTPEQLAERAKIAAYSQNITHRTRAEMIEEKGEHSA